MSALSLATAGACRVSPLGTRAGHPLRPRAQHAAQIRRPARRLQVAAFNLFDKPANGSQIVTQDRLEAVEMVNLVHDYFEFLSQANMEVARRVLETDAQHKDMVRDVGYNGLPEIEAYVRKLKDEFPSLYVKATQFGVANQHTMFVAFEGRAAEHLPLFKGVDVFSFQQSGGALKIKEVQVYRSAWVGAKGHDDRKRSA